MPPPESQTLAAALADRMAQAAARAAELAPAPHLEPIGVVQRVGDGVATVRGLPDARLDELLLLGDTPAMAIALDRGEIGCVLLGEGATLSAGDRVRGTGDVVRVPVGDALLGRVIDPLGRPLDEGLPLHHLKTAPVERAAPEIVDRAPVSESLHTGILVVDAMTPLGRGQRQLVVGDRKTGKTTVALDAMIRQRDSDVICVYAAIGQKSSTVTRVIEALRTHAAFDRCIVVAAEADAPPGLQWIAPYAACTVAELFRDRGQHALVVFDDLTRHAAIHREIALLMRTPPGREAYPGDVFYLHARLLERSARLSEALGGGSLTALPIAETQAGNLTAYIPTNLVSITDGQVYLDPELAYRGQRPAVDVGLSVSRVGGRAQSPVLRSLAERLKLEYAQFLELEVFARFGGATDARTRATIAHGQRIRAVLSQRELHPWRLADEVALLLALKHGVLDAVDVARIAEIKDQLAEALDARCARVRARIDAGQALAQDDEDALLAAVRALIGGT